jgi:hypothetical protein
MLQQQPGPEEGPPKPKPSRRRTIGAILMALGLGAFLNGAMNFRQRQESKPSNTASVVGDVAEVAVAAFVGFVGFRLYSKPGKPKTPQP